MSQKKTCNKCKKEKELTEFYNKSDAKDGKLYSCKVCHSKDMCNKSLKRKYGLSVDDYNTMLENQGGVCKICGVSECSTGKSFAVDHCHTSGKIRDLLCSNCNTSLGGFKDNVTFLQNAIDYLKEHHEETI